MSEIKDLKEGMDLVIKRGTHRHHGVVTSVWPERKMFQIIYLTGNVHMVLGGEELVVDSGIGKAECQKLVFAFEDEDISFCDYGNYSIDKIMNIDRDIIKFRAEILYRLFHTMKLKYDITKFNSEHFASYCVTGWAYSSIAAKHNGIATRTLDNK